MSGQRRQSHCSVFVATSLDGFVAREDGGIDWLDRANACVPLGEDCGYADFMNTIDALVMGRHTFELARAFDPWPYGATPVVVLSARLTALPPGTPRTVSLETGEPEGVVARLAERGLTRLYVDGGLTVQRFLADGLIDEVTVTVVPVLIGVGRRLFGPLAADMRLEHVSTRTWPFGFVQTRYRVIREG